VSWGVKAKLGNLRISDDFIRNQQQDGVIPYPFICDMRDPAGSSFIEVFFLILNPICIYCPTNSDQSQIVIAKLIQKSEMS
jgi:hypothetical protein